LQTPPFITQEISYPDTVFDFHTLRAALIELTQLLSGSVWTDYNEHDSGVTIIEQLCYALTELAFRTDFSVADFLADSKTGNIDQHLHALYAAEEIFVMQPLTEKGYRKLFLDQIPDLLNVWIEPFIDPSKEKQQATYHIFGHSKEESNTQAVCEKIATVFHANRNLCENLAKITPLLAKKLTITAEFEVNKDLSGEEIVANAYFALTQYFSPTVPRYTLAEMQAGGSKLEEIFIETPLENGFIKDQDLKPRHKALFIADILTLLLQVKGIVAIRAFQLKAGDKVYAAQHEVVAIEENEIPFLQTENCHIVLKKDSLSYTPDNTKVQHLYQNLKLTAYRSYQIRKTKTKALQGKAPDFDTYYSIQEQFPAIYLLGKTGIPTFVSLERQAQAKQLQGYLLVFEQLMANHLAQLKNIGNLFSTHINLQKTYFTHSLQDVAGAEHLLASNVKAKSNANFYEYEKFLQTSTQSYDSFIDRRNRFLDYLLALYGVVFQQYSLSKFNYYFGASVFEKCLLYNKIQYLKELPQTGRNRFRAADLSQKTAANNQSGLEILLRLLLDIETTATHKDFGNSVFNVFEKYNLELSSTQKIDEIDEAHYKLPFDCNYIENYFDSIEEERLTSYAVDLADHDLLQYYLEKTVLFATYRTDIEQDSKQNNTQDNTQKATFISPELLQKGVHFANYRVGKLDNSLVDIYYLVCETSPKKWLKVGLFASRADALYALSAFVSVIRKLNRASEGLYVVENFDSLELHIIFSAWAARCADLEFRKFAEETILLNMPAHILPHIHWLPNQEMMLFEALYREGNEEKIVRFLEILRF
jgi:hypothetical protein